MILRFSSVFPGRSGSPLIALAALGMLHPACAADADGKVVTPYVQYSILYDDNLLRLRNESAALSAVGTTQMSDYARTAVGGIKIDKSISRQRIMLDASLNRTDFDYFRQFDNSGKDLKADWGWTAGNYLSGDVGYVYSEALTPFQNFRVFEKNMRTQKTSYATAAWRMHPDWTLRTQFTRFSLDYDLASQLSNTLEQNSAELGLDYTARSGSVAGIQLRHSRGTFPYSTVISGTEINNSFKQDEIKAKVLWLFSGKTRLQFLGGWVDRKRDMSGAADYSGFNARAIADWAVTGQTLLTVNLWREIGGLSDVDANYALTNGVSLGAKLQSSDKLRFDGFLDVEKRNYNGAAVITGVTPSSRRDKYERASLSVTYSPTTSLSLIGSIFREHLQSNIDSLGYVSNGVAVTTRYEF
ncbi:exopolysaccharide biosynthesis operon protein EpsL [Herbaspirillum sp. SJZ130]|nr:exopolysaccharide biosynthesis operon protein EpsL [Herbaspirillum sp. SJZ130]TQK09728.1 exopolysaccharide biosynthesis operon protein EpsL [Herbaspirillum sp. SJZ106]TWC65922.1 exopolysaccharide biosynthesis operon protein EpsL [Herbaspirillum sp. SJZ099]